MGNIYLTIKFSFLTAIGQILHHIKRKASWRKSKNMAVIFNLVSVSKTFFT